MISFARTRALEVNAYDNEKPGWGETESVGEEHGEAIRRHWIPISTGNIIARLAMSRNVKGDALHLK
jgi:hypothetical protein